MERSRQCATLSDVGRSYYGIVDIYVSTGRAGPSRSLANRHVLEQIPSMHVRGGVTVYRLFDVGYEIDLATALECLAPGEAERARPVRSEAQALLIPNPPITVRLGIERLTVLGQELHVAISARIFDFGVASLRAHVSAAAEMPWAGYVAWALAIDTSPEIPRLLERHVEQITQRTARAIEKPHLANVREDYTIYRINEWRNEANGIETTALVSDVDLAPLLLGETRPLSESVRRELLPRRFSYHADDLAVLTWDTALVVDREPIETDVEYIVEFANAQLLELRYYDAALDAELPALYDRIERARAARRRPLRRAYSQVLGAMQTLVAATTEVVERAENALKVTDDVYLARVYSAALEVFRARQWRAGIDRKLGIIRETYGMLNAESQAARGEVLEIAILALIAVEIVLSFFR